MVIALLIGVLTLPILQGIMMKSTIIPSQDGPGGGGTLRSQSSEKMAILTNFFSNSNSIVEDLLELETTWDELSEFTWYS